MAPPYVTSLSPAELAYLHSSLSLNPPIRPDARTTRQFRPLVAETDILPSTNGSARICFADGTEAVVGVKAEVEKTKTVFRPEDFASEQGENEGQEQWVEMSVEIPGYRDDDGLPIFLAEMLREGLVGEEGLQKRLVINRGWHWRLFIDILLLSPPLSYPLPLLSLTTHLALISTNLPALKSQGEEDPLFDDDWAAAVPLYKRQASPSKILTNKGKGKARDSALLSKPSSTDSSQVSRPPVTLLVICVGKNIIFDPSAEEIAVAETVVAVTIMDNQVSGQETESEEQSLSLRSLRMIDPPARMSQPGVALDSTAPAGGEAEGVWNPPKGGVKRNVIIEMVKLVLEKGGVGEEVLAGLGAVIDGDSNSPEHSSLNPAESASGANGKGIFGRPTDLLLFDSTITGIERRQARKRGGRRTESAKKARKMAGNENKASNTPVKRTTSEASDAMGRREVTRKIKVEYKSNMDHPGCRLYLGNLPYAVSVEELLGIFKGFLVEDVTIPINPRTNRPVGYAFVEVRDKAESDRAIAELSGTVCHDRKITVQLAREPAPPIKSNSRAKIESFGKEFVRKGGDPASFGEEFAVWEHEIRRKGGDPGSMGEELADCEQESRHLRATLQPSSRMKERF